MEKIYSDNGKTFVGAKKWLKQVMRDKKTQDFSAHENIKWQFNLSRTAWWGGQYTLYWPSIHHDIKYLRDNVRKLSQINLEKPCRASLFQREDGK